MVDVGLERAGRRPTRPATAAARGSAPHGAPLELRVVELVGEIGIGVDDADHRGGPRRVPTRMSALIRRVTVRRVRIRRRPGGLGSAAWRSSTIEAWARPRAASSTRWPPNRLDVALQEAMLEHLRRVPDRSHRRSRSWTRAAINALLRARSLLGREERELVVVCPPGAPRRVLETDRHRRPLRALRHPRGGRRGDGARRELSCGADVRGAAPSRPGRIVHRRPAGQRPAEPRSSSARTTTGCSSSTCPTCCGSSTSSRSPTATAAPSGSAIPATRSARRARSARSPCSSCRATARRRGSRRRGVEGRFDEALGPRARPRRVRRGARLEPGRRRAGPPAADAAGQRRPGVRRAVAAHALQRRDDRRGRAAAAPGRAARARRPQPVVLGLGRLRARAGARHRARRCATRSGSSARPRRWAPRSAAWRCCTPSAASRARSGALFLQSGSFFIPRYDAHE